MPSPAFNDDLCFLERIEDFSVEQFITEFGVEAFTIAVLPWAARHNVSRLGTDKRNPLPQSLGDEFRAIVGTNMPRNAPLNEQIGQNVDNINSL